MHSLSRQILRSLPLRRFPYRSYSTYNQVPHNTRLPAIFGAVLAVAGLVGWQLGTGQKVALDNYERPSHASTQLSAHVDEKQGIPQPRISTNNSENTDSDLNPPDTPQPPQTFPEHPSEEESEGGGAFNPETGEINWDCPCLGGMAHGPCGLQFREAFSCFVFSEKEPKGTDCIEKFRLMQECFREHPEVYGEELVGDDEADEIPDSQALSEPSTATTVSSAVPETDVSSTESTSESQNQPPFSQ